MSEQRFMIEMTSVKRGSTTTRVREAIREAIITNNLQPGDPLPPEGEIALLLEVSRTSVREAIRSLEALGMVEVRHGHGIFVKGFDFDALLDSLSYSLAVKGRQIKELLEVREGLEIAFVPLVIANITEEGIEELETIVARMRERAARNEAFPEEDRDFHLAMYRWVGNDLLLRLIRVFWVAVRRLQTTVRGNPDEWDVNPQVACQDHEAILEALKSGDAARTEARIREHYAPIKSTIARIEQGLES